MSIGHGALPGRRPVGGAGRRAGDQEHGAGCRTERLGAATAANRRLHMATRKAASACWRPPAGGSGRPAGRSLKRPRGRFRVREWERERIELLSYIEESDEALGGAVQYLEEIGFV
ncbi:hypothetical protein R1flu_003420 [Riccia fluitans]|uniref:Uncharacterized protein n=1 Tax=Riccia fluitans TaxID=41844 RepID=A0ABD1Y933_9MARC